MNKLHSWFTNLIIKSDFHIEWIPLSKSRSWFFKNGKIVHKSGHFFKIIGFANQPLIDQREIGVLGFLIRERKQKNEILVQAKIEPGNLNTIQLAPTCQATKSNSLMIHGGSEPPFSHLFNEEHPQVISNTLQSEQGSRFYKKRNRNILALSNQKLNIPDSHKWIPIDKLLNLLSKDYLINTDARSVLVCSPWGKLVNRIPFSRTQTTFVNELNQSYQQKINTKEFEKMKKEIILKQRAKYKKVIVPIDQLKNWKVSNLGIEPIQKKLFRIRYIKVKAKNREVPEWDQPIIDSYGEGRVDLICGRINGVLHFNFKVINEPGLYNNVELSPITENHIDYPDKKVIASILQSDEGGRFYQDTSKYQIIDIGKADMTMDGFWLNLAQIQNLSLKNCWFTNEARSVLSLLLYWL